MDPSSERSRGWNSIICKEVLLVYLWEATLYCWVILPFMRWRGIWCWEDDVGSDSCVVILSSVNNKFLWFFLDTIVYLWILLFVNAIVWSMYFWFCIVYGIIDRDALMVFCCFASTCILWSGTSRIGVASSIKGERKQARSQAEDPGWSSLLLSYLPYIKEITIFFDFLFLR